MNKNQTILVEIEGSTFEVVIEDLETSPIKTTVNGTEVLVTIPETNRPAESIHSAKSEHVVTHQNNPIFSSDQLLSPLPGKIVEVFVKSGDHVEKGQVVVIIEAMKMKNSIRSIRSGTVKQVHVAAGDGVSHKQLLVEFTE